MCQLIIAPLKPKGLFKTLARVPSMGSMAEMRLLRLPLSAAIISTDNGDAGPAALGTWEPLYWAKDKSKAENERAREKLQCWAALPTFRNTHAFPFSHLISFSPSIA